MRAKEFMQDVSEGLNETQTVTRIDSKPITDFASGLKAYKHTDDWSQSGIDTGNDSYWRKNNLQVQTTKGLFAGDPKRTALYATGNAHETRYVEFTQDGKSYVYFDVKDVPKFKNRKTYLSVFDAKNFRKLPTGEYFSDNPGEPIKQTEITNPFEYIKQQGWNVRVTNDLNKVFKQVKDMHKKGKIPYYGGEGMSESRQDVSEGWRENLAAAGIAGALAMGTPAQAQAQSTASADPIVATVVIDGEQRRLDLSAKNFGDVRQAERWLAKFMRDRGIRDWQGKIERGQPGSGRYQRITIQGAGGLDEQRRRS